MVCFRCGKGIGETIGECEECSTRNSRAPESLPRDITQSQNEILVFDNHPRLAWLWLPSVLVLFSVSLSQVVAGYPVVTRGPVAFLVFTVCLLLSCLFDCLRSCRKIQIDPSSEMIFINSVFLPDICTPQMIPFSRVRAIVFGFMSTKKGGFYFLSLDLGTLINPMLLKAANGHDLVYVATQLRSLLKVKVHYRHAGFSGIISLPWFGPLNPFGRSNCDNFADEIERIALEINVMNAPAGSKEELSARALLEAKRKLCDPNFLRNDV